MNKIKEFSSIVEAANELNSLILPIKEVFI